MLHFFPQQVANFVWLLCGAAQCAVGCEGFESKEADGKNEPKEWAERLLKPSVQL